MCPDLGDAKPQVVGMGGSTPSEFPVGPSCVRGALLLIRCWDIAIEDYVTFVWASENHDLGTKASRTAEVLVGEPCDV